MSDFKNDIKQLDKQLMQEMHKKWERALPFEELISDRWERAKQLGFGVDANIYANSYVYGDVKVGKNTWIGPFTILEGKGGIKIGNYCSIASGVHIYTHDSILWALSGGKLPHKKSAVIIKDNCYIGAQSIIGKGVTIGEQSIIGANSFINKNVPPRSIVAGNPGKIIGKVEIDDQTGEINLRYNNK